jgi:hypothetical protein
MPSSWLLCHVAHLRTDVSEECIAAIIRVRRIVELGTLSVTSNQSKLRRNTRATRSNIPEYGILNKIFIYNNIFAVTEFQIPNRMSFVTSKQLSQRGECCNRGSVPYTSLVVEVSLLLQCSGLRYRRKLQNIRFLSNYCIFSVLSICVFHLIANFFLRRREHS